MRFPLDSVPIPDFEISNLIKMRRMRFFTLLLALFFTAISSAQIRTNINSWLIAGSFTDPGNQNLRSRAFISEPNAAPKEGELAGQHQWKLVNQHVVDFKSLGFANSDDAIAYAFTYVYSEANQMATLQLGSDDGAMVWVNGILVFDKAIIRGVVENEDKVELQLFKGVNRILVKVDQRDQGWGMVCNILSFEPVKLSINRPLTEELATGMNLQIAGASVLFRDKNVILRLKTINFGESASNNVQLLLVNGKDVSLADKVEMTLLSRRYDSVDFVFPLKQAVRILSQTDNSLILKSSVAQNIVPFPGTISVKLFMLISKDKSFSDVETQKLAQQIEFVKEIYSSTVDLSEMAIKGLQYVTDGNKNNARDELRKMLDQLVKNAPDYSMDTIHIIGHAHMDMNWLWPYSETKKMMHDNMRQVIAFMHEFPDYTMLQSQINIYKQIEKVDPPLFEEMKKYVREGRLEPVGGMWAESDCNLTGGEALCRTFLLGQRYLYDHFGKIAHVGWLPDDFGHISQLPQILNLAGCNYYYFMRCNPYSGTFWWKGPDSSTVLCFSGNSYNNSIKADFKKYIEILSPLKHRILMPTGVGDHGGGPTLADISMAHKLDSTPHYPAVKFTTAEKFFRASMNEMDGRPTHRGEMQYIFEGCYTSVAEIKENTRKSEQSLYKTEFISTLRWLSGENYPSEELKGMWETVAFNQFHDILPGSAIYETYQDAVSDHKDVQKRSNDIFETGFRHLADEISFKTGLGQPVVALNMQARQRKVLVQAEIFTHEQPATAVLSSVDDYYEYYNVKPENGKISTAMVVDNSGKVYPAQIIGGKRFPPGFRSTIQFVVDKMPAGGYKSFYIDATKPGIDVQEIAEKDGKFETDFFTVAFDIKNGDIIRLKDKKTGKEFVKTGGRMNRLEICMEEPNDMNAWTIGTIKETQDINDVESVRIVENGPVRATIEVIKKWRQSKFVQRTYIYKSYPRIDFDLDAHWFEIGDGKNPAPFLKTTFDIDIADPSFYNQVPFDVVKRPTNGQEVPAQQWVDITDGKTGIALLNKTKFGHSFEKGQLRLSLLRATYLPDMYPNLGINHIQYSLYPHAGDWKNGVWAEAENFNIPVYAAEPPSLALVKSHATRAAEDSLIIVYPSSIVMCGIKQAEDGKNLIIRLAEVCGNETLATITLPFKVKEAQRVNIIEFLQEKGEKPIVTGNKISIQLKAHEILTLSILI